MTEDDIIEDATVAESTQTDFFQSPKYRTTIRISRSQIERDGGALDDLLHLLSAYIKQQYGKEIDYGTHLTVHLEAEVNP